MYRTVKSRYCLYRARFIGRVVYQTSCVSDVFSRVHCVLSTRHVDGLVVDLAVNNLQLTLVKINS